MQSHFKNDPLHYMGFVQQNSVNKAELREFKVQVNFIAQLRQQIVGSGAFHCFTVIPDYTQRNQSASLKTKCSFILVMLSLITERCCCSSQPCPTPRPSIFNYSPSLVSRQVGKHKWGLV